MTEAILLLLIIVKEIKERRDGMDDKKIIELYFKRSEDAISETERKYGKYCYSIARRIVSNDEDAKEIVNDTYLKAWNTIPPNKPDPLSTYLGMICRQTALNRYKETTRKKRGGRAIDVALDELIDCIPSERENEIVDRMLIAKLLNSFLESLPKKTRMIFIRRYWYMDAVSQIADTFAMSESGVKMTLFRARLKLKKYLKREGIDI